MSTDGVNESVWYRENETKPFQKIMTNNFKTTLWPVAFSEHKTNVFYAISNVNRDKNALVEIDCNTGKEKSVLFANDTLNVVEAQYSKRRGKMDFVVYETWKKEKHYLGDEAKAIYEKLDELIPEAETKIIHHDKNEQHFIVRTFTDRSAGAYYLYFTENNYLKKLSDINPSLKEGEMCEMKPISYLTTDGFRINGYLTLPKGLKAKNLPVVVMPHNGPGQRNVWGFNGDVQFLANRGYAVLQVNYRGSTGYGKEFYAAGFKEWGAKIQQDVDAGVQWLIRQKIADPERVAIYGYGFGGLVAINSAIANPERYKCAGSNSGVLNLFSYLKTIPPYLTSNLQMFYEIVGNTDKDAEYMRHASPVFHADKVKIPIFITQNAKDPRINGNDAVQFVKELRKHNLAVTYLEKEDSKSVLSRDESRKKSYAALELFLQDNLRKR
jgi:dipeptidyl aminopeptidase/acylaminoacyl peptidase